MHRLNTHFIDPVKVILVASVIVLFAGILFFRPATVSLRTFSTVPVVELDQAPIISDSIGDRAALEGSLEASAQYLKKGDQSSHLTFGNLSISRAELLESVEALKRAVDRFGLGEELFAYVRREFRFLKVEFPTLATGYYEPELRGSRQPDTRFRFPIYKVPPDLLHLEGKLFTPGLQQGSHHRARVEGRNVVPYFDRAEIDYQQVLSGKNLEILWVDDELDLFFLHIQGSGIIRFEDGTITRVGYAEKNGRAYRPIGKVLLDRGLVTRKEATMQGIKSYLRAHPDLIREILSENPSYVFFEERQGGPFGNIAVALTPYRSIATDAKLFPKGALMYLSTTLPTPVDGASPFSGFVLNQDTGGAITGPGRLDLFTGHGERSAEVAGRMRQSAEWYLMLKRRLIER